MKKLATLVLISAGAQVTCSAPFESIGPTTSDVALRDSSNDMRAFDTWGPESGLDRVDAGDMSDATGRCPRGRYFDGDRCNYLAGCSGLALVRDELGCVFFPDTAGRLTAAECETDEDCVDSPYGPNCILRVCHEAEPCTTDDDCDDGLVCINRAACMPPRSECEDDEDCEDPAVCFDVEQLCI